MWSREATSYFDPGEPEARVSGYLRVKFLEVWVQGYLGGLCFSMYVWVSPCQDVEDQGVPT